MPQYKITLTVTAQDEPIVGDYEGTVPDQDYIEGYIAGAWTGGGLELLPGVTVDQATVDEY